MPRLSAPSRRDCSPDSALAARSRRGGFPSLHRCIAAVPAAVLALLLLAAPGLAAQTDVWTATLTPGAVGLGSLGCNNNIPAARCRSTSVLSDDDFTHKSTDYTINALYLRTNGTLQIDVDTDFTTETDALTLMVGATSLLLSAATDDGNRRKVWSSTGLSLTAGTDVEVKLVIPAPPRWCRTSARASAAIPPHWEPPGIYPRDSRPPLPPALWTASKSSLPRPTMVRPTRP